LRSRTFTETLSKEIPIGVVGGSDLVKQQEQLGEDGTVHVLLFALQYGNANPAHPLCLHYHFFYRVMHICDYSFSQDRLVAFKDGALIGTEVLLLLIFQLPICV
jgi:hypothetical protein